METSPVIVIITKHGKDVAALVNPEDIKRMDALIIHLTERARQVLAKEDAKQSAEARRLRAENREIDELMARAVQELFDGDPTLLREMATKYLES